MIAGMCLVTGDQRTTTGGPSHSHVRHEVHSIMSQSQLLPELDTIKSTGNRIVLNGILHLNFLHEGSPVAATSTWEPYTGHSLVTGRGGRIQSGTNIFDIFSRNKTRVAV